MPHLRLLLAGAAAALAALALPALASADTVASPGAPTAVREFAGNIVFSQFDPTAGRYFLSVRRAGAAAPERLPVAASTRTFDADIGPGSSGKPELIYQRCAAGTGVPRGCDLFVYALDGSTGERPVSNANDPDHNDTNATIWRGRIAWARDYGSGQRAEPDRLHEDADRAAFAALQAPARRSAEPDRRRSTRTDRPTTGRTVQDLELWGENLALTVSYGCGGCAGIDQSELRLDDLGDGSASQVAFQVVGLSGQTLVGPSFFNGRLGWYKACLGDPVRLPAGPGRTVPLRPDRARLPARAAADGARRRLHRHRRAAVRGLGCAEETSDPANANCRIDTLPAPTTRRPRAAR